MKVFYSSLRLLLFYVLDSFVKIVPRKEHREGILLIRVDAIGDFVIWLDSAREYRRLYPGEKITLCLNSVLLELAQSLPHWDQLLPVHMEKFGKNPWYRIRILNEIRCRQFKVAIQPTFSRSFSLGDAIVRASGATQRVGFIGDNTNMRSVAKRISDNWYSMLVPAVPETLMELERNAEFIRNLSGLPFAASLPTLPARSGLPRQCDGSKSYFVVFPGAAWSGRRWPIAQFVEVIAELHLRYGWDLVVCGGVADQPLCQRIADQYPGISTNLAGKTSLPDLVEMLRNAKILISNETSAVHLATAVSTPSVCILGGGHFGRFMPYPDLIDGSKPRFAAHKMPCYHCNWHCSQPHQPGTAVPCVSGVTAASVLREVGLLIPGPGRDVVDFPV